MFRGDLAGPQGVSQSVEIAIEAATNGQRTLIATVLAPTQHAGPQSAMYALADQIINSVRLAAGRRRHETVGRGGVRGGRCAPGGRGGA